MLPERHFVFDSTEDDQLAFDSIYDNSSDMDDQSVIDTPESSPISDVSDSEILNMESSVTKTEVSEDSTVIVKLMPIQLKSMHQWQPYVVIC